MGYCLYGNDINEDTTPYEANLMWATNLNKDFIGKDRLVDTINKSNKRMINFKMIDRGVPEKEMSYLILKKLKLDMYQALTLHRLKLELVLDMLLKIIVRIYLLKLEINS